MPPQTLCAAMNPIWTSFLRFSRPPETETPTLVEVTHLMIREFMSHLHDLNLEKSSIARKLAAIRSFFKFAVREGMIAAKSRAPGRDSQAAQADSSRFKRGGFKYISGGNHRCARFRQAQAGRSERRTSPAGETRPGNSGTALCLRVTGQRTDRLEPCRYRTEGADAASARQRQQGTNCAVRRQGGTGSGSLRPGSRRYSAEGAQPRRLSGGLS